MTQHASDEADPAMATPNGDPAVLTYTDIAEFAGCTVLTGIDQDNADEWGSRTHTQQLGTHAHDRVSHLGVGTQRTVYDSQSTRPL